MSSPGIDCFSNHLFAMFNRRTSVIWLTPPNSHQPPCVNKIVINKIYLSERTHRVPKCWRKKSCRGDTCVNVKFIDSLILHNFRCTECRVAAFSLLVLMERWFIGDYIISHVHFSAPWNIPTYSCSIGIFWQQMCLMTVKHLHCMN